MKLKDEFLHTQQFLLMHKYFYYVKDAGVISDQYFDHCEQNSFELAKKLGFRADKSKGPTEEEKHHVHWMIGFDETNPYWEGTLNRYTFLKN